MKLVIEYDATGPMAHKPTKRILEEIVEKSTSLDEAYAGIKERLPNLGLYRGGSHIAIHPTHTGKFSHGSDRVAMVTE